jgi:beta-ureidopropionase / N-carbamoyl-L-amino-acid hydrolase
MTRPQIDPELLLQDIDQLATIGADPEGGVTRMAYTPADLLGRAWVAQQMRDLGMLVATDPVGNTIGRYSGLRDIPCLMLGSHTDTVRRGGHYDGALGVLAGLACVRALRDAGVRLRHPVEVVNFAAEEATLLGTLGSRAMIGDLSAEALSQPAYDGRSVAEHLQAAGFDPGQIPGATRPRDTIAAYVELHIEQGDQLELHGVPIGLVEGIVGIRRYHVTCHGQANHAGTTSMDRRQDALVAAAQIILAVRDHASAHGLVGTTGTIAAEPNVPNVIPGRVTLSCEIRGLDPQRLDLVEQALRQTADQLGATFQVLSEKAPVDSDPRLMDMIGQACDRLDLPYQRMPSGAGHDAMSIAQIAPQAMIFVPSIAGISHAPEELTTPEQCVTGARVLLETLLLIDAALDR